MVCVFLDVDQTTNPLKNVYCSIVILCLHFQENESHRKEWIRIIQRDLTITKNIVVRIKHFHEDDILLFKIPRTKTCSSTKVCLFQ